MLSNLWAFIKGALGGLLGCIGFVIFGAIIGMDFSKSQWLLYWFFTTAFLGGFVTAASNSGYGIFSMILFIGLGIAGMHFFSIMAIVSLYQSGLGFNALAISSLGITGVLLLRWYKMIGEGESNAPWLLALLAVLIGFVAGYVLGEVIDIGAVWVLVISAVVDGVCLIIMLILRIKNGSALDY